MKQVLYTSPYVPAEWIAAHGLHARRVTPGTGGATLRDLDRQGVCPFVRSFASEVLAEPNAAGIVMTTVCDQMRRTFDVVQRQSAAPAFLMNVPSTWQSGTARRLYIDELNRLGTFLSGLGGTPPSNQRLVDVMLRFDEARASLRALSPHRLAEVIEQFDRTGRMDHARGPDTTEAGNGRVPVALVGGPRWKEDLALFDMVEQYGGYVALDATESGPRSFSRTFDRPRLVDEPFLELADAYFDGVQDIARRPNDGFYESLAPRLRERRIAAIILQRCLWCDLWHAEVERFRQRFGLPVLDLDLDGEEPFDTARMRTRVGAFMEMLT